MTIRYAQPKRYLINLLNKKNVGCDIIIPLCKKCLGHISQSQFYRNNGICKKCSKKLKMKNDVSNEKIIKF